MNTMRSKNQKKLVAIVAVIFLALSTFFVLMPGAAASPTLTISPDNGPVGTQVQVTGEGFNQDSSITISFAGSTVATTKSDSKGDFPAYVFIVPASVSPGNYAFIATDTDGDTGNTLFNVTSGSSLVISLASPTPIGTSAGTSTGTSTGLSPTNVPVTASSGFWSPLTIAITLVVIAFAVFMTAFYIRRGRQKPLTYEQASRYEPKPSTPSKTPTSSSNINQPYQPSKINQSYQRYQTSTINQPATNIQQPHTIACRHCKRTVRDDLNICPYCSKKLR
jgi:hypothetical protein